MEKIITRVLRDGFLTVMLLSAAGCVTIQPDQFKHATKSEADFTHDRFECETAINQVNHLQLAYQPGASGGRPGMISRCLTDRFGWQRVAGR